MVLNNQSLDPEVLKSLQAAKEIQNKNVAVKAESANTTQVTTSVAEFWKKENIHVIKYEDINIEKPAVCLS